MNLIIKTLILKELAILFLERSSTAVLRHAEQPHSISTQNLFLSASETPSIFNHLTVPIFPGRGGITVGIITAHGQIMILPIVTSIFQ
jgi:hypothetical protein